MSYHLHYLLSCTEQGCYTRFPLQYEVSVRSTPHQHCYLGEWFSCWNSQFLGWKIHLQGSGEVRHCLFTISSPERWIHFLRSWHWTCIKFSCFDSRSHNFKKKDIRKYLDGISVSEKGTGQQADKWDLHCPAIETTRCQVIPQPYLDF